MKYLLIPLAFVAGQVVACPVDGSKEAMADANSKPVVAVKAMPTATLASARASKAATAKPVATKVASKSATEPRKTAPL